MRYQVLGPLRIWTGPAWSPIRAGQQRGVLAVLLAEAGRVVTADRLIDEIWGGRPPRSALTTLQGYVARLRRLLGGGTAGPLATRGRGYELTVAGRDLDANAFRGLVSAGRQAIVAGRHGEALAGFTEALDMWRGSALADVPATPTVTAYANRLEQSRLDAVEARVETLLMLDDHAEAATRARALVDEHPLRERSWAMLMLALHRSARRAEALESYQQVRRVLAEELGIEPGPELRELQQAILSGVVGLHAGPGATATIRSGMSAPVRAGATAAARVGATVTSRVTPAQLPADVAGFTGRQLPLKQLDALLEAPVAAIAGAAGVGKTALAVHWAHQVRERFPDGQLHVNLRGFGAAAGGPGSGDDPVDRPLRPMQALVRFLIALGMSHESIPADQEAAADLYRSLLAGKRMLVLLDNARDSEQVRPLLPGGPGCLAVVTSRERLGGLAVHEGAARLDLDALSPDEARTLLARMLGAERVAAEPAAADELSILCGRLPLALRIAAANLSAHPHATIVDYADRLRRDRLDSLEIVGEPQGGIRAAFQHSYASLPESARELFRLLGLVPGPDVTAAAAAALAGVAEPAAAARLDRLTGAHLVDEHAHQRYALHDLVREYAADRARHELSEADRAGALDRLGAYYLRGVAAAADHLYPEILRLPLPPAVAAGPAATIEDHVAALSWLDAERANLVAAVAGSARAAGAVAWRLADALRGYLMLHRHTLEWSDVARSGLAAAQADGDLRGIAAAQLSLAALHWAAARYEPAMAHYRPALELCRRAGWVEGEAATLGNLGLLYWLAGKPGEAAEQFIAALALDERTGRLASRATNLSNLGLVYGALGKLALAAEQLAEAAACFRRIGSRSGEASALANLGEAYHDLGRLGEAREVLVRALAVHRETGERRAEAETVRFLACVERDLGRTADALRLAGDAVRLAREADDAHGEAEALVAEASVRRRRGDRAGALTGYRRALELARRDGHRYTEAQALIGLASVASAEPAVAYAEQAVAYAEQALGVARRSDYRLLEGGALTALAIAEHRAGRPARAISYAEQALAIHTSTGLRLGEARTLALLAEATRLRGRPAEAAAHHDRAAAILADTGADLELASE